MSWTCPKWFPDCKPFPPLCFFNNMHFASLGGFIGVAPSCPASVSMSAHWVVQRTGVCDTCGGFFNLQSWWAQSFITQQNTNRGQKVVCDTSNRWQINTNSRLTTWLTFIQIQNHISHWTYEMSQHVVFQHLIVNNCHFQLKIQSVWLVNIEDKTSKISLRAVTAPKGKRACVKEETDKTCHVDGDLEENVNVSSVPWLSRNAVLFHQH